MRLPAVLLVLACGAALLALVLWRAGDEPAAVDSGVVAIALDGDTLTLDDGRRIRLVQVDAPELSARECHAGEARDVLRSLVPPGTVVELEADPELDGVDRFGRALRYVRAGGTEINVELVRRGAAAPYFFQGDRGRLAEELLDAADDARAGRRGLWGRCPGTALDPGRQVEARP